DAQKAQRRFSQHHLPQPSGDLDDYLAQYVGSEVASRDPQRRGADGALGLNELLFAQGEHLTAHQTPQGCPPDKGKTDEDDYIVKHHSILQRNPTRLLVK